MVIGEILVGNKGDEMGWMLANARKHIYWGDEPQDVIDDEIAKELGNNFYERKVSNVEKAKVIDKLIDNKKLRVKVDRLYQKEWHRPARDSEYENLIRVALNIGGATSTKLLRTGRARRRNK